MVNVVVNVIGCGGMQGALQERGRDEVHDQRVPLLQLGFDHQRRGCRGYHEGQRERVQNGVDEHEPQLGAELAIKRSSGWSVTLLQGHRR